MIGAKLDSAVGFWSSFCIGVSSIPLSVLRMLSKASHDNSSCSQSDGIEGAYGSTPVPRRQVTIYSSHPLARGGVDEEGGNVTPVKCGWEDVAFQTSRDLGEICEAKFLGILNWTLIGWIGLISAREWFFSKDVAPGQRQDGVFKRKDPLLTLLPVKKV